MRVFKTSPALLPSPEEEFGSQGCEISPCNNVNISMFTSRLFTFTWSNKSSQSADEVLSCAKCSQHDCFGDRENRIPDTGLLRSSGSMKLDCSTQGWEVSRSDAREDTAHLQRVGHLLTPEGSRGIWGLCTGAKVEQLRSTCFHVWPALVPFAMAGREAPGMSSCPICSGFRIPRRTSCSVVTWWNFFNSHLQRRQWYKLSFGWHS